MRTSMTPDYTVLLHTRDEHSEILFRAKDGVRIGQRKNSVVVFGESPNKSDSRMFIDEPSATTYLLTKVAKDDWIAQGGDPKVEPVIEHVQKEGMVVSVGNNIDLPGKMSRM